jgi:hypothetical protein
VEEDGVTLSLGRHFLAHYLHKLPCGAHEGFFEFATLAAVAATYGKYK